MSIFFILTSPLIFLFTENKSGFFANIFSVLFGKKSWVGRDIQRDKIFKGLKPGVLSPSVMAGENAQDPTVRERLNLLYAKDFKVWNDLKIVMGNVGLLGS